MATTGMQLGLEKTLLSGPLTEEYVGVVVGALVGSSMYCVISRKKTYYLICYFLLLNIQFYHQSFRKGSV